MKNDWSVAYINGRYLEISGEIYFKCDNLQKAGRALLKYATQILKKEKAYTVFALSFQHSFNYKCFRRSGYFNLPVKFRPPHLFLGVRSFKEFNKKLIEERKNWYIGYSDSDTV
ncbi:MAG: hypothetical protein ABI760_01590 [Ferruginibacter sp.]